MYSRSTPQRWAANISVVGVLGIFAGEWVAYHVLAQPEAGWALLFNVLLLLSVWSYLQTCLTNPGTPDCDEWQEWARIKKGERTDEQWQKDAEQEAEARGTQREGVWRPGQSSWCSKCRMERPERAHHCSACGLCVLRMDHHCPWIGSCVGWRNHKYFVLVTWWSFLASAVFLLTLTRPSALQAILITPKTVANLSIPMVIAVMSVIIFGLLTGILFVVTVTGIIRNVTTIEDFYQGENPYCLDSTWSNLQEIFGAPDLRWLIPVPCTSRPSDGTRYRTRAAASTQGYGAV
eukprot:TRINITY_DN61364_c0_g1_i1.p1 TRINITY_DN61364_c0_g1~~TRINITY_DN61364_c0_g1_i1.p1  ORF type:complete len:291 (-),score=39.89 TRINITY_DN61364_c0_g1_i1:61-933(-)